MPQTDAPPTTSAAVAEPATPARKKRGAVKMDTGSIQIPEPEKTTEYLVGTRESCPMLNVTLAGVSFPRVSGGSVTTDPERRGARVFLTDAQVEACKKAAAVRIVRKIGSDSKFRGELVDIRTPGFRAKPGDEWLAKHVYMQEVAAEVRKIMDDEPEAMA